ncbi:MAG: NAD-dependent succinate-semialdehyde dehydrogenase [Pseudomonadota bacterium]
MRLENDRLMRSQAFVGGVWIDAAANGTFSVENPANGEVIAEVAHCGGDEARRAVEAAKRAFPKWRALPAKAKGVVLQKWADLIKANLDDLASLLTAEQGKPLAEARGEILYGVSYIEWFAAEATRIYGDIIAPFTDNQRIVCLKEPVGVVACITPWNFPNAMLARKIAPALAAGCTVVCKPANETPLSALALGALAEEAGVPAGVVNILCGDTEEIGEVLISSKGVHKLSFTGSTRVGKMLQAACAATMKRTSMELGGNAPFIVFDDADLDAAVDGAMASKFRNAGQTCVCANRMLVQETVYDAFAEKLAVKVRALRVGDGASGEADIGPLIHARAARGVRGLIDDALGKGARAIAVDGFESPGENFVQPTLLLDAAPEMRVFNEEIFGPVAPLFPFKTEEEAVAIANDTPYGLASYIYTRDIGRIWRVSEVLEYGMVGINEGAISNAAAPFGGVKESGHGREGSKYGLDDYLNIKYLCMGGVKS